MLSHIREAIHAEFNCEKQWEEKQWVKEVLRHEKQPVMLDLLRVLIAVVTGLFSLPALLFGGYFLACWIRIHTSDVFYVEYPYLTAALVFGGIGISCAFCSVYGALRRNCDGFIFVIPFVFGLATASYIPDGTPHIQRSMMNDGNFLSHTRSFLPVWYESHQRFPTDEGEFREALKQGAAAWHEVSPRFESDYAKGGKRLQYKVVIIRDATGPKLDGLSDQPGVIYYCVSGDNQRFWVTMTSLHQDVSGFASF